MARKLEVIDENGNAFPPPEPGTPVAQIIYLLEYGRSRGFRIGPTVQVGDTIVQVRDLRQEAAAAREQRTGGPDIDPESDMGVLLAPRE